MDDDRIPEGGCIIALVVGVLALVAISLILGIWLYLCKQDEVADRVVPKAISDRMKRVHGTPVVLVDWDGSMWFERDGKRCKF